MNTPSDVRALTATFKALGCEPEFADFVERTLAPMATEVGAWLELAATLRRQNAYEAALHTYATAERRFPNIPQLPNNKGILLRECGLLEEALFAFSEALRLNPVYASALANQGNVLEYLGRFPDAEDAYKRLLAIEPNRVTVWNNLGNCAYQLGRKEEARRYYEHAIEIDPDYVFALVNLAGLIDELGNRAKATILVDRALRLDPLDEEATKLQQRFLQREPGRALDPPAWNLPSLDKLQAAERLHDFVERQNREVKVVPELLKRTKILNERTGFLGWDPERLAAEPDGDPGPAAVRLSPPTPESPRLYLAYAWSRDDPSQLDGAYEQDMLMDAFAGRLFNAGYEIIYDRDPRNLHKGLSEIHVLRRLYDCNFFVPVVTERYLAKIAPVATTRGMVGAEWDLACQLASAGFLSFIGVWLSGEPLPDLLNGVNTIDLRDLDNFGPKIAEMFPGATAGRHGVPKLAARPRPQEPTDWPKYTP